MKFFRHFPCRPAMLLLAALLISPAIAEGVEDADEAETARAQADEGGAEPSSIAADAPDLHPAMDGYADYDALTRRIEKLAESPLAAATALGKTEEGRQVYLLTLGRGDPETRPAILLVGGVVAWHAAGSELALRAAEQIVAAAEADPTGDAARLLERFTLYVIPRPNPDGIERNLKRRPWRESDGNARLTDDDRDFDFGEDPPDDLNGDGWITMMRVEDPSGDYMPHPDDPRVLIRADAKKNERGRWRLYPEGRDDDGDEAWNEDPGDGVSFNRNFPFRYPYFERQAGPHAVSEPETRAVADFAFDRTNIWLVFTFTPEDNLMHPWKHNPQADRGRIRGSVTADDAAHLSLLAERYRKLQPQRDAPPSPEGNGSFSHWAYFHLGRWSLAARGWWIPAVTAEQAAETLAADAAGASEGEVQGQSEGAAEDVASAGAEENRPPAKASDERRGADEVNALRWFAVEGIDGFIDWKPLAEHPDFPGRKVEVGGFKSLYRWNPPAERLGDAAAHHVKFLAEVASLAPDLEITEAKAQPLGGDVYRITTVVINRGYLPTAAEIGEISRQPLPLQIELALPDAALFLQGHRRTQIPRLPGSGGRHEHAWLVRIPGEPPPALKVRVYSPSVGDVAKEIPLHGE